jgi:vacuolar-type H+-ATPase subunit E/Vma4
MATQAFQKWDEKQDKKLLELYCNKTDLKNIANDFARTHHAIQLRLAKLCFNYYKDDIINKKEEILIKYYSKTSSKVMNMKKENELLKKRIEDLEKQLSDK